MYKEYWYITMIEGQYAGYSRVSVKQEIFNKSTVIQTDIETKVVLNRFGYLLPCEEKSVYRETFKGLPINFEHKLNKSKEIETIEGNFRSKTIELTISIDDEREYVKIQKPESLRLSYGTSLLFRQAAREGGKSFKFMTLDYQTSLKPSLTKAHFIGEEEIERETKKSSALVFRLERELFPGLDIFVWWQGDIQVKSIEYSPLVVETRLSTKQEIMGRKMRAREILADLAIFSQIPLLRPRKIFSAVYNLNLIRGSWKGLLVEDNRQKIEIQRGNYCRIKVHKATFVRGKSSEDSAPPEAFLDTGIYLGLPLRLANGLWRKISATLEKPADAVLKLHQWIATNMKEPRLNYSYNTARKVAKNLNGGCYEATLLFCSLARNRGIPARAVGGIACLGGAFLWHVWAEAYIDNQWIALDPSLGMGPVDATYIGFCKTSLDFMDIRQNLDSPLSRLMGNLDCTILRYREEHRKTITLKKEARLIPLFRIFDINKEQTTYNVIYENSYFGQVLLIIEELVFKSEAIFKITYETVSKELKRCDRVLVRRADLMPIREISVFEVPNKKSVTIGKYLESNVKFFTKVNNERLISQHKLIYPFFSAIQTILNLRFCLYRKGFVFNFQSVQSFLPQLAKALWKGEETISIKKVDFPCYKVNLETADSITELWYEKIPPHRMVQLLNMKLKTKYIIKT